MNPEPEVQKLPLLVWWIIWGALLSGVFAMYFALGRDVRPAQDSSPGSPAWMACFLPFAISVVIRWVCIPRLKIQGTALAFFIVGLAMAEMPAILGLFVFPEHKLELFAVGVIGLLQMAPYFASRLTASGE